MIFTFVWPWVNPGVQLWKEMSSLGLDNFEFLSGICQSGGVDEEGWGWTWGGWFPYFTPDPAQRTPVLEPREDQFRSILV